MRTIPFCFETRDAKQQSITARAVLIGTKELSIMEKTGGACEKRAKTDHGAGEPEWKLKRCCGF